VFTQDAAFNFEMKKFILVWVQLVPDFAIFWYAIAATKMSDQQKRAWESKNTITSYRTHLDTCCVFGYLNQTAEAVERK